MRRNMMFVVGLAATVSGCSMFSAHSDVIEEAAGQRFTADRLADILTRVKAPMQYDTKTGAFVTNLWTDMTLFAQGVATNKITTDSAFVAEATWPMITQVIGNRWADTIVARKANISDAMVDSAYNADKGRAVQHILIKADSTAPKEVKDLAHKKIEGILAKLKGGESFSKLAFENTEDPGSKADSGYYGPKPKGQYVPSFEKALWSLKPGEVSGIVTTNYGYHILRRLTAKESAHYWRDSLSRAIGGPVLEAYTTELSKSSDLKVDGNALPHMRAAVEDLQGHFGDKTALATYTGGAFTTGDFVHWINAALADPSSGPDRLAGLKAAPDSQFKQMVNFMAQQTLLLNEAKKNNVHLTADEWKELQAGFSTRIDSLKAQVGLTGPAFDAKVSQGDRSKAAATAVDNYFNDLVTQKKTLQILPGILAATLREHDKTKFNAIAMQHGLDLAKAKHTADSTKDAAANPAANALPEPGALKPAPGGPPTGAPPATTPPPAPKKP